MYVNKYYYTWHNCDIKIIVHTTYVSKYGDG